MEHKGLQQRDRSQDQAGRCRRRRGHADRQVREREHPRRHPRHQSQRGAYLFFREF